MRFDNADGYKSWWLNGKKLSESEWKAQLTPTKELTVEQIQDLLGYKVKVIEG